MVEASKTDADAFRPGHYFTGSVIVRLRAELAAMRTEDLLHASARSLVPQLAQLLTDLGVKSAQRLVKTVDLDSLLELERFALGGPLRSEHSLSAYWQIDVTHREDDLRQIVEALLKVPEVDDAYLDIHVVPASVNASDDPFSASQGYLRSAPEGIDAQWAWTQAGGDGSGVGFADVEEGWNVNHEDLAASSPSLVVGINRAMSPGNPPYSPMIIVDPNYPGWNHGTGALGVIAARDNSVGIVGIAPGAGPIRLASVWDGHTPGHVVDALVALMTRLSPGDVVMLELQTARGNITGWPDNHPIEIKDAERDAIRLAVSAHNLVVIAAAGNGGVDLDTYISPQGASAGKQVLKRSSNDFQDSGSIMVGSATSTLPHRRMNTMENQSNFGSRIDCYAWGENVATCGAAILPDMNTHANRWYRTEYNGTSAATPIVAGAATLLQSIQKASSGAPLWGLRMRALLSDPAFGTAPSPSVAAAKIGVMPDLRKLTNALGLVPDIFLRDSIGDDGVVPSTGTLASSPDIIVRDAPLVDPQGEFGEGSANANRDDLSSSIAANSSATVYLRARNRGGSDALDVVGRVWWSPPATLVTPDLWSFIGQTAPFNLAADQSLTVSPPITWSNVPQGHVCLVAAIGCARDPAPPLPANYSSWADYDSLIRGWNNITWRNIIVASPSTDDQIQLPFRMVGSPNGRALFDFELDVSLSEGCEIVFEMPAGIHLSPSFDLKPVRGRPNERPAFILPHRTVLELRNVTLPPGSGNEARLTVTSLRQSGQAAQVKGWIILKQRLGDHEMGRITWRLIGSRR